MKIETLQDRIEKAEAKIFKKQNTIIKKQNLISKKTDEYEIRWLQDDIKRLNKEIQATQTTLEKYRKQLAGELEKESIFINEIPESIKQLQSELVTSWDEYDKRKKAYLKEQYNLLKYDLFIKKHKHAGYDFISTDDEVLHRRNVEDARMFVLDLYNRVKEMTGEITSWSGVHLENGANGIPALNGFVIGKEGRVKVESILAGGYNIQKLHIRVLVKEF